MSKRTWMSIGGFATSLFVVFLGLAWMSSTVLELHEKSWQERRRAALEENVRLALWRMDSALSPLIARESSRPYFVYASFYPAGRAYEHMFEPRTGSETLVPSPLMTETVEHVVLHFQMGPDQVLTSPTVPKGAQEAQLDKLKKLKGLLAKSDLLAKVPKDERQQQQEIEQQIAIENQTPPKTRSKTSLEWLMRSRSAQQASVSNNAYGKSGDIDSQASQAAVDLNLIQKQVSKPGIIQEGPVTPVWIEDVLLLVRRVRVIDREYLQGCWLDWPHLEQTLLQGTVDLLPNATLLPTAKNAAVDGRRLASVPAAIVPGDVPVDIEDDRGPVRLSLFAAWIGVALAVSAVVALLFGTLALSERRAAFVSAVTHELRTPLTTFRMYSEMLAEGMVTDETKKKSYLDTLRRESVRLSHLVENVLAYAKIERGRHTGRIESLPLAELLSRFDERLRDRAQQVGLTVELELPDPGLRVRADAAAIDQILFNLVDNACKYAAAAEKKTIAIYTKTSAGLVCIVVRDFGPGITPAAQKQLFSAFSRSAEAAAGNAPGVGLGLALSRRLARTMRGDLVIDRRTTSGACFELRLPRA